MSDTIKPQNKSWITRRLKAALSADDSSTNEVAETVKLPADTKPKGATSYPGVPHPDDGKPLPGKYHYVADKDIYVTYFKNEITPILITGETHRAMCRDYSNWTGTESTVQNICDKYSFPKAKFNEYKDLHGWSHDHPPFTKEEIVSKPKEQLVEDLIKSKTSDLRAKAAAKEARDNRTNAEKWVNLESSISQAINSLIEEQQYNYVPKLEISDSDRPYAVVISPMDLHFGKGAWRDETGQSYSRSECSHLLKHHTEDLISRIIKHGRPDEIIWIAGSDYLHIDNEQGRTTAGTPQDLDGTSGIILKEGFELAIEHIDLLRQVAPVRVILASGNHDQHSSIALLMFIHAWYRETEDVDVNLSLTPRNYMSYGNTLIVAAHGDKTNSHTIAKIIPHEARELWSDHKFTALFTGHLHYELSRDDSGIMTYQIPSMSGSDRYHSKTGYVLSRRALAGYMIDFEDGPILQVFSPVKESKALFGFNKSNWRKKR